jgi:putative copper export protein
VLSPNATTIRLFLHVLAAAIWVGGQFALAGVVPTLRTAAPEATGPVARAFARLAWPAFAVLVITGLWNIAEVHVGDTSTEYQITLMIKITLAILSGVFAAVHAVGRTKLAIAIGGSLGGLCAIGALFFGILLTRGTA